MVIKYRFLLRFLKKFEAFAMNFNIRQLVEEHQRVIVLELFYAEAQLPPRLNVPGAILLPSNRPQSLRPQRILNQDNVPLPIRVRKPAPNALPISIPIREDSEEEGRSIDLEEEPGRLNVSPLQSSLKQLNDNDDVPLPKPIQFRPERPALPPALRQNYRELDNEPPVIRQAVRQPQLQAKDSRCCKPRPISQHLDDDDRRPRNRKPPIQILRKYRTDNDDGSITWGYESEDGTFKEETIGADCIIRGKYGYIDPEGTRREYSYETGNKCEPQEEELPVEEERRSHAKPLKNAYNVPIKV
ncbi:hypothetical protein FQA39_LY07471 [Lamprigera yunnana]|nr:hypothetical protein FQA39_LY07471 [Lamprigera yunnana]